MPTTHAFRVLDELSPGCKFHLLRPRDIPVSRSGPSGLQGIFGYGRIDRAAERLVHYFVPNDHWCGFTLHDLKQFYSGRGWIFVVPFYGLMGAWFDVRAGVWKEPEDVFMACRPDGTYYVTDRFVEKCGSKIPA